MKPYEKFAFDKHKLISVPEGLVNCKGCFAQKLTDPNPEGSSCWLMPNCNGVSFITQKEFESNKFKVKLVEWRMGLKEDE